MDKAHLEDIEESFKHMTMEEGMNIVDLPPHINNFDLLSYMYHDAPIVVQKDENLFISAREKQRFVDDTICYVCGLNGHLSSNCPEKKFQNCYYCDRFHKNETCQFLFCFNCGNLGHNQESCRERSQKPIQCEACPNVHDVRECCRNVRCYFGKFDKNANILMSCPYCFSDEHFSDDCKLNTDCSTIFTKKFNESCQIVNPRYQFSKKKNPPRTFVKRRR